MKLTHFFQICLISSFLLSLVENLDIKEMGTIEFKLKIDGIYLSDSSAFKINATFNKNLGTYLYMYPQNLAKVANRNKAAFRIYFRKSCKEKNVNYLETDYATLELNSALYIKMSDLDYNEASIFIIGYEKCEFMFDYQIVNTITFPKYDVNSNFQLSQFKLPFNKKYEPFKITFDPPYTGFNDYIMIISKTSLRNIEIKAYYGNEKITDPSGGYLYPNGYSIYVDRSVFSVTSRTINIEIINKNENDETLILGYMHLNSESIFPNKLYNGMQLYVEGNIDNYAISPLNKSDESISYQYFTYQSYSQKTMITFVKNNGANDKSFSTNDYNSMFYSGLIGSDTLKFNFRDIEHRTSLYIQYLEFNNNKVTQKLLQPLVSGSPKSILLPQEASLYHFLPKERKSTRINYYLRAKTPETKFVSFTTCSSYPETCEFDGPLDIIAPFIKNIGLWYSSPTKEDELQIIYIYCNTICSYDVLMTYDDDPLFLFPSNNYTKFIGKSGKDGFLLPVLEDLSSYETIKIDLTVISGKGTPKLTLYKGRGGNKITNLIQKNYERKISYIIGKSNFTTDQDYYKKDIYAVVEGEENIFYNLMYEGAASQNKLLDNNRIIIESLTVPEKGKESDETKIFNFNNYDSKLYISISTKSCESVVIVNKKQTQGYIHNLEETSGTISISIYLINNSGICQKGFEETVTIFAYSAQNPNVLIGENNLVNATLNAGELSFVHLFKTNNNDDDNSYNIEIEKLSEPSLTFSYSIERITFNSSRSYTTDNTNLIINEKKNRIISSKEINEYCGGLEDNEICMLTMNVSSTGKPKFSIFLNKNDRKYARYLTQNTLISSINSKSIGYFYFDLDRDNDTEFLINSFGQDLEISTKIYSSDSKLNEETGLPSNFMSIPNSHKFIIPKVENCKTFCQFYIALRIPKSSNRKEYFSTFSLNYFIMNSDESPNIYLPLNYFSQYSFLDSSFTKMNYYVQTFENTNLYVELYAIKKNEEDNSLITATIEGETSASLDSSTETMLIKNVKGYLKISLTYSGEEPPAYKLKVSDVGYSSSPIIPLLSSYSSKCKSELCFYTLDISQDNEARYAYLFVPELENVIISIKKINYGEVINPNNGNYDEYSNKGNKRKNWIEYEINEKNIILLIRLSLPKNTEANLFASFNTYPNLITLNYAEKRIFTIENNVIDNIAFNITKPDSKIKKYKIYLHSVKGNGIIYYKNEAYTLGLNSNYKENMSIIFDNDAKSSETILMKVSNKKDTGCDEVFSFTIEYIINSIDQFFYEIKDNAINSFKFNSYKTLQNISFYMKTKKAEEDISMNIKIFSKSSKYDIFTYIVDDNFIENKTMDPEYNILNSTVGINHRYIDGGTLSFVKLDISSKEFEPYINGNEDQSLYIYIVFSQKTTDKKIKIDIYPYKMPYANNFNWPLSSNQFFIQKLTPNAENYPLLLSKNDLEFNENIHIDFISPFSNKYKFALGNFDLNQPIKYPSVNETDLILESKFENGVNKIIINSTLNKDLLFILFNIISNNEQNEQNEQNDYFIFKYSYENQEIYDRKGANFSIKGETKEVTFEIVPTKPKYETGESTFIINAYDLKDIKGKIPNEDYSSIYLLFSDIKPIFTTSKPLNSYSENSKTKFKVKDFKKGEFYFTCVEVIEDNERQEYIGYKAKKYEVVYSDENIIEYIKDHVIESTIIFIIILLIFGIMVNSCRNEKKGKKSEPKSSNTVELILEDKNIN